VHKDIAETFIAKYKTAVEQLKFGDPMDKYTDVSVMIDEKNAMRVENWINEGIEQGAQLLTGGKREKTYVAPTLLTNTKNGQKVHDEEVFGPVVCIEPVNDEDEGIARLNATRFGLQAGIFTNNHSLIQNAFNNVKVGGVMVNDVPTFRVDHMPYGGIKDSGMGREGVAYTIKEYMEPRLLVY
jgi:glyceraldehyde-3-phosphate dehydrogenase (NADP+)